MIYCLHHFSGDEKVKLYLHQMIDPSVLTEEVSVDRETGRTRGLFSHFTEDDYLALRAKDPESLFQEVSYMKHLRRHSTRYSTGTGSHALHVMFESKGLCIIHVYT